MQPVIADATIADRAAWDRFLGTQPNATYYHLAGWQDVVSGSLGHRTHYLCAREEDRVVGVLPLVLIESRLFGRILCSLPFVNYGGPCAESEQLKQQLARAAMTRAGDLRADYLELRCADPLPIDLPVSMRKVSLTIALGKDQDEIWNSFTAKHRKNVRRAFKNDLSVVAGGCELLPHFYATLERSWRDLGTPLYRAGFFRAILETFPNATRIYICRHAGAPVAAAMVGFHGGTAEGLWQGNLPIARSLQAGYVLYWEMIRDVAARGCRRFHLGRSTVESGSEQFKSRWNAETEQLYWYFHRPDGGPMPALHVDNPKFRLAIAAWRRLPLWMARLIGPPLARCIP